VNEQEMCLLLVEFGVPKGHVIANEGLDDAAAKRACRTMEVRGQEPLKNTRTAHPPARPDG